MKLKLIALLIGFISSTTLFAQSSDSAQNNTSSTSNMTNPYTTGVNRYLSPNQTLEVQNMLLQNNILINQQFALRDSIIADLQNQINALKNRPTGGGGSSNASCFIPNSGFGYYRYESEYYISIVNTTVPHGTPFYQQTGSSSRGNSYSPRICNNGIISPN